MLNIKDLSKETSAIMDDKVSDDIKNKNPNQKNHIADSTHIDEESAEEDIKKIYNEFNEIYNGIARNSNSFKYPIDPEETKKTIKSLYGNIKNHMMRIKSISGYPDGLDLKLSDSIRIKDANNSVQDEVQLDDAVKRYITSLSKAQDEDKEQGKEFTKKEMEAMTERFLPSILKHVYNIHDYVYFCDQVSQSLKGSSVEQYKDDILEALVDFYENNSSEIVKIPHLSFYGDGYFMIGDSKVSDSFILDSVKDLPNVVKAINDSNYITVDFSNLSYQSIKDSLMQLEQVLNKHGKQLDIQFADSKAVYSLKSVKKVSDSGDIKHSRYVLERLLNIGKDLGIPNNECEEDMDKIALCVYGDYRLPDKNVVKEQLEKYREKAKEAGYRYSSIVYDDQVDGPVFFIYPLENLSGDKE